ncbi:hypothetical protein [Streptomyces venezuelae]|uniref:Secreted protein n=1 Tax=Streptomyces venezuelae TaxID=54571 RepID=A0A5P2ATV2_STRVZ|nr:hypothetical protein [Streptomyces venezuelae]QES21714.1 hypothetical protein DEJ46_23565 [Streptomyces venezuelae]QES21715.1 hypothetical protein DEJ46_23570 [Streptomyces venezuelae]
MKLFSRTTAVFAAGVTAITLGVAVQSGVSVANATPAPAVSIDPPLPPLAVETFEYPDAARIFQERGIKLKSGDGHITLATCGTPGLIEIRARGMDEADPVGRGLFCFKVTGKTGRLDLEIPAVIGAKANDYAVKVHMATGEEEQSYDLKKNSWNNIGETADPQGRDFTLLQIVAAR